MQAIYQQYRDEGFTVLAVNMQEDPATVEAFMQAHDLTFPVLLDTQGEVSGAYHARVLPSSFFIDRQGTIRAVYRGPLSRGVMDGMVRQLLAETGGR
jgi:peroxiredoxin